MLVKSSIVLLALAVLLCAATAAQAVDYLAVTSSASGGSVQVFNPTTGALVDNTSMTNLGGLEFVSFGGDGKLYANRYQDTSGTGWDVARFATGTWSPLEEFASFANVGRTCVSVRAANDGYVYMGKVNGVYYRSNTAGAEPEGQWGGLGGDGRGMAIGPDGTLYYASAGSGHIAAVNIPTSTRLPNIALTAGPHGVSIGPKYGGGAGYDLYVTYWGQSVIDIYDPTTGAKVGVFDSLANYGLAGSIALQVVFSGDGGTAYFTDWSDGIIFKKVGSAPATPFAYVSRPRSVDLTNAFGSAVPEPSALAGLGLGMLGLLPMIRRKRSS